MINKEQKRTICNYALALVLCVVAVVAANWLFKRVDPVAQFMGESVGKEDVLGLFQAKAQLATTEVSIRRMGIYDSETKITTINPANWKVGRRACIMPVDITIKYGIDMQKMSVKDISTDTAGIVTIRLPQPEVIDYHVVMSTDRRELVTMSGWLRDEVGEQTIQTIKNKVVEEVLSDTVLFNTLRGEIQSNTRAIFSSMLQQMCLKPVFLN